MRFFILAICLILLAACATTGDPFHSSPGGKTIESAILWETKRDETWTPLAMSEFVKESGGFKQQGNFYKVKGELIVFGHRATYVGMLGVGLFHGPNAVLKGTPKSISSYISEHHGAKFERAKGSYVCDYKTNIKIIVEKPPNIRGSSIIIGSYTGP